MTRSSVNGLRYSIFRRPECFSVWKSFIYVSEAMQTGQNPPCRGFSTNLSTNLPANCTIRANPNRDHLSLSKSFLGSICFSKRIVRKARENLIKFFLLTTIPFVAINFFFIATNNKFGVVSDALTCTAGIPLTLVFLLTLNRK